jgi:hypothetical protein
VRLIAAAVTIWAVLSGLSGRSLPSQHIPTWTASADSRLAWSPPHTDPDARWQRQSSLVALDPFVVTAGAVAQQRARGRLVLCRLSPGLWEPRRPDAGRFDPAVLGSLIAAAEGASAGARWVDVRRWDLIGPVLVDRLTLCRAKGFDGVVADHVDGYAHGTGFALRPEDQQAFNRSFATAARRAGLRAGLAADAPTAAYLGSEFDFVTAAP